MTVSRSTGLWAIAAIVAAGVTACGGGDGDSTSTGVTYKIGGTVSGLDSGKTLVLQNNGADDLTLNGNGTFNFATQVASGAAYAVTVKTQPSGQTCGVTQGTGTAATDVSNVAVACSATSTTPGSGSGAGSGPTQGATALAGTWIKSLCVVNNGKGNRQYIQVTQTGQTSVSFGQGVMQYAATNCSGSGTPFGPATPAGNMVFSRSAATSTLAANWGLWTYTGGQVYAIWAKKGETVLCIIGDANPSALPTASDVEGYADLSIAGGACYVKQ